jgi:HD-GYP domain-containing protein (c-di-GMP phosphodiesterase class II)
MSYVYGSVAQVRLLTARGGTKAGSELDRSDVWDALDQFVKVLQQDDRATAQIRAALEAARDGVRADAVYWHPGLSGEQPVLIGTEGVSLEWCGGLAERLLGDTPGVDSQLRRTDPRYRPCERGLNPQSVAMVRVSKSRNSWILAVSFDPGRQFQPADMKVLSLARRLLLLHRQNLNVRLRLRETVLGVVRCLAATIDAKNPYTAGHSERVARIAVRLGRQMRLPDAFLSDLHLAGLLHDIGKIGTRDDVLCKEGPLTAEEFAHMKEHPVVGDQILANIQPLAHLRPGVRNHHERYDGKGYPDGLVGEDIPLLARVLAVADACDAMMADRPYRSALPPARIDVILAEGAGSQWDPNVVKHFLACRHEVYPICQRGLGESVYRAVQAILTTGQDESLRRPESYHLVPIAHSR